MLAELWLLRYQEHRQTGSFSQVGSQVSMTDQVLKRGTMSERTRAAVTRRAEHIARVAARRSD
jgi:hypothetical protein